MTNTCETLTFVRHLAHKIHAKYNDPAQRHQIVWWLVEAVTGKSKVQLLTNSHYKISAKDRESLHLLLHEHAVAHKPLQYLIGSVPFGNAYITVAPPTLIPRPETEEWCLKLIEQLKPLQNEKLTILDMCTGSGCIAVALAQALPNSHIYAADIAFEALELARKNALTNNIKNITFLQSDLFTNIPASTQFDLIVSNPPYIAHHVWETLEPSVKQWEDSRALVARNNGLEVIQDIITQAPFFTKPNLHIATLNIPQLWIEIGYDQGSIVEKLMHDAQFDNVNIAKDLAQHDRVVHGSPTIAPTGKNQMQLGKQQQ